MIILFITVLYVTRKHHGCETENCIFYQVTHLDTIMTQQRIIETVLY